VQRVNYPKEQMHRIRYTKLSPSQISEKLTAVAAAGPACASPYTDALVGKTLQINTDGGPSLNYVFKTKHKLAVSADGHARMEVSYGALALNDVVLVSHLVPGTQQGYNVVLDLESGLVTVMELWFSGYQDNREIQRHLSYGYIEVKGKDAPKERHAITNRLEGRGYHWKQDTGVQTLEFYPSVLYSNFVELTRSGGELSFCGPSDYIKLNDEMFVYSRVEAEFSGAMTLYVLDLNTLRQVGMRLGFDEQDALQYYMFTGTGEPLGQIAHFEPFDDHGEKIVLGNRPTPTGKGERPVYRPLQTNPQMTKVEVEEAVAKNTSVFAPRGPMAGNGLPLSSTSSSAMIFISSTGWKRRATARWGYSLSTCARCTTAVLVTTAGNKG
jgi:hypothetical protein